jgi:hypothetical protein
MLKKTQLIESIQGMRTKEFWREYISIYSSIMIVTLLVQSVILHIRAEILILCLIKSLITTIPNVLTILYGRNTKIIKKHWFRETILYTLASMPYVEISLIYLYSQDTQLMMNMIQWYLMAYFTMGLIIKDYLQTTKKLLTFKKT